MGFFLGMVPACFSIFDAILCYELVNKHLLAGKGAGGNVDAALGSRETALPAGDHLNLIPQEAVDMPEGKDGSLRSRGCWWILLGVGLLV